MMQAGYEEDSLFQLAGITKPYNQFELQVLTNKVLKDLHLDYSDKEKTIKNYIYFIIKTDIENPEKYYEILKEFRDINYSLDMDIEYQDFALLYWAKRESLETESQCYWEGAYRTNIDNIIREQFENWVTKLNQQK